jgi:L-rhamnose mutarotase
MEYLNKKVLLRFVIGVVMVSLIFVGCKDSGSLQKVKRYASVTGLKEEKIEEYKKLHAAAWPKVLKRIKACNIQNYSIYFKKIDGKNYLFSYFEYVGDDFELDMQKMEDDPETQRWWKETDPCQIPLPDAVAKGATWSDMEEVFHTD